MSNEILHAFSYSVVLLRNGFVAKGKYHYIMPFDNSEILFRVLFPCRDNICFEVVYEGNIQSLGALTHDAEPKTQEELNASTISKSIKNLNDVFEKFGIDLKMI